MTIKFQQIYRPFVDMPTLSQQQHQQNDCRARVVDHLVNQWINLIEPVIAHQRAQQPAQTLGQINAQMLDHSLSRLKWAASRTTEAERQAAQQRIEELCCPQRGMQPQTVTL
jgi:hypothetical protein